MQPPGINFWGISPANLWEDWFHDETWTTLWQNIVVTDLKNRHLALDAPHIPKLFDFSQKEVGKNCHW